ncbi:hypothetical protein BC936DRAFT_136602, partial [Jimgerdemannia flammicorona]
MTPSKSLKLTRVHRAALLPLPRPSTTLRFPPPRPSTVRIPPAEIADPTKTRVPVQAHFGREDEQKGFSDPVNAVKLEAALVKSGVKYELH